MFDREVGGVRTPRKIIDRQIGPECGFEAVGNVIQLVHPVGNNVSEKVLKLRAALYGFSGTVGGRSVLDPRGYQRLLAGYRIASTWSSFNADELIQTLRENRVAIVVVDPAILDPEHYAPSNERHTIVVTNFGLNSQQTVIRYTGVDSNVGGTERHWLRDRFYKAVAAAGFNILITDTCIAPQHWETYHVLTLAWGGVTVTHSPTP